MYRGKDDKSECNNYRGINLLSGVEKEYGRIILDKMKVIKDELIRGEQMWGSGIIKGANICKEIINKEGVGVEAKVVHRIVVSYTSASRETV